MLKSAVALSAAFVGCADAFWRMECPTRSGLERMDAIMDPGEVSRHVHAIHGSSGFSASADYDALRAGDCTSCRVTQDKSAYWHPALFFQDEDTGEFELVEQVGGMLAYYLLYGENVTAFPPGFRMISGVSPRRTYTAGDPSQPDPPKSLWSSLDEIDQDTLSQRALGFNCLNYDKPPEGTLYRHYMPDKSYLDSHCKDGLRLELMFPSCWKGGDHLDSENHKDHMAFPDLVMTGTCPDDYPVRVPSMLFEVIWNTPAFENRNGRFVISNGDPTGYGYHGDFMMGWDEDFLQQAIDTCTNPSGRIEDCPLFNIVDQGTSSQCEFSVSDPWASQNSTGPGPHLPGEVPVTYGDGEDDGDGDDSPPASTASVPHPTLTYKPGETPSASASPLPGQVFKESSGVPNVAASSAKDATTAAAAAPTSIQAANVDEGTPVTSAKAEPPAATTPAPEFAPVQSSDSFFSTQYITDGDVVSEILWEQEIVYVTEYVDAMPTAAATTQPAQIKSKRRRRMAHVHGHGRGHH